MRFTRFISSIGLIALLALVSIPATLAQEAPDNTITVVGTGSANTDPNIATVELGVEIANEDISAAYNQANMTLQNMIDALTALGINADDIQTSGINVFSENMGPAPDGMMQTRFRVANRVSVTVRDLNTVDLVIDTAVNNGANSIYGLQFSVSDTRALASDARIDALNDARDRAQQIADYLGVALGDVISVTELGNGAINPMMRQTGLGGGGMAVIEPGSLTVPVSVEVTFSFNR